MAKRKTTGVPDLEPRSGSWVATSPSGQVVELFKRENAEKASRAGWRVETALQYLSRINREIAAQRNPADRQRARRIVKLAAAETEDPYTREWLHRDERGIHEQRALELLEIGVPRAAQLGATDRQLDEEIASVVRLEALTAVHRHAQAQNPRAKKKKKKKGAKTNKRPTELRVGQEFTDEEFEALMGELGVEPVGREGNPRGGLLRGLATAGLALVGAGGIAMGARERKKGNA